MSLKESYPYLFISDLKQFAGYCQIASKIDIENRIYELPVEASKDMLDGLDEHEQVLGDIFADFDKEDSVKIKVAIKNHLNVITREPFVMSKKLKICGQPDILIYNKDYFIILDKKRRNFFDGRFQVMCYGFCVNEMFSIDNINIGLFNEDYLNPFWYSPLTIKQKKLVINFTNKMWYAIEHDIWVSQATKNQCLKCTLRDYCSEKKWLKF